MSLIGKLSFDVSSENRHRLEKIKRETGMKYGATLNALIQTFCDLPYDVSADLFDFCKLKVQLLYETMDSAGEYEAQELLDKADRYLSILRFLNHGIPVKVTPIERKPAMRTVPIKDGVVTFPSDWIIVNPEESALCSFAGVVECRNSEKFGIPHFLFFNNAASGKDYSEEELSRVDQLCAELSPEFASALQNQVSLKKKKKNPGKYLNIEEHLSSPFIGHFALYVKDDASKTGNPPYGAMIIRNQTE